MSTEKRKRSNSEYITITIKKKSNHTGNTKRAIIKGYTNRAKALCDPEHLQDELKNIKDVFEENRYDRREIEQETNKTSEDEEKEETR